MRSRAHRVEVVKGATFPALVFIVALSGVTPALSAPPSAENARACRAQAIKAHPTHVAGSAKGSAQAQRTYFQDCMAQLQAKASKPRASKKR
jgi:hypothetical protein